MIHVFVSRWWRVRYEECIVRRWTMCVVSTMFVIVVDLIVDLRLIWSEFS